MTALSWLAASIIRTWNTRGSGCCRHHGRRALFRVGSEWSGPCKIRRLAAAAGAGLCVGCAGPARPAAPAPHVAPACSAHATSSVRHLLYFGRNIPGGGIVGDSALTAFLADEVAVRFPDGFTIWDATGHWRGAAGRAETEKTLVLMLLHPGGTGADSLVRAVALAYKARFRQEAVLHERGVVCSRLE